VGQTLARRRILRHHNTDAEAALWLHLRGRRLGGFKFRRQHPCGPFVLDFYCSDARLAIELDGGQHFEPQGRRDDARRDEFLSARLITVMRFQSDQVFTEMEAILTSIAFALGMA
jgi:very-short-patch-repair endonuclease